MEKGEEDQKKKRFVTEEELIQGLENDFEWSLLKKTDVQAAYLSGLFFQLVDYDQGNILNTRGLRKKMRYLFPDLDREKLQKIFASCIEIQMAVMDKQRNRILKYGKIRPMVEEKMLNADWSSMSEELSIGFMTGYDLYWKVFGQKYPKTEVNEEENQEDEEYE